MMAPPPPGSSTADAGPHRPEVAPETASAETVSGGGGRSPVAEPARAEADSEVTFPLRVAAIDVGSNAIRFVAAEFTSPSRWFELESRRPSVRLGHGAFLSGHLARTSMDAAVDALAGIRRRMDALEVGRYRAVATSAVRESVNGAELIERVRRECGIHLEPITGGEEARLVWLAVRSRVALGDRNWILVDLGGGSVEVSLIDDERLLWSESHTMGSVRLLEELSAAGETPERVRRLFAEYAGTLTFRLARLAERWDPAGLIATGGNIEALARLAGAAPDGDGDGVGVLPLQELRAAIETLSRLTFEQRIDRLGLREDRADVILPAAVVYERIGALAGVDHFLVPYVGLKEGLLLDLVDELATHSAHEERQEQVILAGALALGRRYLFDEPHARHVANLSLSLFDQLRPLHGLGGPDRRILLAAAVLHDIGQFISYRKHHKHSYYVISQSELPGLTPRETQLAALVARYHRRAEPQEDHEGYRDLPDEERGRIGKLASLLRVADSLDREHLQQVSMLRTRREDGELVLELEGRGELLLEQWALRKKAEIFERTYGLTLRLARMEDA